MLPSVCLDFCGREAGYPDVIFCRELLKILNEKNNPAPGLSLSNSPSLEINFILFFM